MIQYTGFIIITFLETFNYEPFFLTVRNTDTWLYFQKMLILTRQKDSLRQTLVMFTSFFTTVSCRQKQICGKEVEKNI